MNGDQLFIGGKEIDLAGDAIGITYQINDLAELKNRQSNFSNQFKAPKTQANIEALEWSNILQSDTRKPYRRNNARLIKNGRQVIPNGYAIIESADAFFHLTVYSGLVDFFDTIEKKKLRELDLSAYNHLPTLANILAANANTSGYKYPIIDFGVFTNVDRNVLTANLRVAFFVHTLVDKIFQESNFQKVGAIFSDANYQKVLMPHIDDEPFWLVTVRMNISFISALAPAPHVLKLWKETAAGVRTLLGVSSLGVFGTFWAGSFSHEITNVKFSPTDKFFVESTGGGGLGNQSIIRGNITFPIFGFVPYSSIELIFQDTNKNISIGMTVDQNLFVSGTERLKFDDEAFPFFDLAGTYDNAAWENITPAINAESYLPDLLQKDLIKTIANQYALFFARDVFNDTIYVARMNDIVNNIPYSKKWGEILHDDRNTWKLEYRLQKYGQKNYLKYKKDGNDKDIIEGTGDGYFVVEDETLQTETTLIELPFSATTMERALIDLDVPLIRRIESGVFKIKAEPRLLVDDTQDIPALDPAIHYDDLIAPSDEHTNVPLCYFQLYAKEFSLGFDNSLISGYYDGLVDALKNLKKFTASFRLTSDDVAALDLLDEKTGLPGWFTPVYIWQLSSYFYVNKVISFTGRGLTKVELIRLGVGDICIPEFGPEIIESNTFDDGGVWSVSVPGDWTLTPTTAEHNGASATDSILATEFLTWAPGVKHLVKITVENMTAGTVQTEVGYTLGTQIIANGAYTEIVEMGSVADILNIRASADFDGRITFVSVKEQLTCLETLPPPTFGPEQIIDGTFPAPNVNWVESGDAGVSFTYGIPGVKKDAPGSFNGALTELINPFFSVLNKYRVEFTIAGRTAGECYASIGGVDGIHQGADGTFVQIFSITPGPVDNIGIYMDAAFDGIITNISLKAQLT